MRGMRSEVRGVRSERAAIARSLGLTLEPGFSIVALMTFWAR